MVLWFGYYVKYFSSGSEHCLKNIYMESCKLLIKTWHKQEQGSIPGFSWVSTTSLLTATSNISRKLSILSFKVFKPNLCGSSFSWYRSEQPFSTVYFNFFCTNHKTVVLVRFIKLGMTFQLLLPAVGLWLKYCAAFFSVVSQNGLKDSYGNSQTGDGIMTKTETLDSSWFLMDKYIIPLNCYT